MFNLVKMAAACAAAGALAACSGAGGGGGTGGSGGSDPATTASTGTGSATCMPFMVPAGTDLMQPVVSFKSDVMGVFNANCGAAGCHGTPGSSQGGLFLGAESAQKADAATVRAGLVGKPSSELATMSFVTAGDPSKSYLMHKMDGDQCLFDGECAMGSCLAEMPSGLGHVLPEATRDVVRRWIAQGAQNN